MSQTDPQTTRAAALPRGTVTFLFTDVEGSTALLKRLGAGYRDAIDRHESLLRAAFAAAGGHEVDTQGDAFFVAFTRARDAVAAAVSAQRALAAEDWGDAPVRVRMGLHTGEPSVGDERYAGLVVHRAARICAAAHGGQVLVSQATREVLRDDPLPDTRLRSLGEYRLKDIDGSERLYQLLAPGLQPDFPPPRAHARVAEASARPPSGQRYRILGPLEVWTAEGPLPLGGQRQRAVLAVLTLHANRVVSTDRLVADLYGERPPPTAVASLQNSISQLRKLLGRDRLVTKAPGYLLRVEPGELDLAEFERLVEASRTAEPEERARLLGEALELWRGRPLADFAFEPFAANEILRLDELRLGAVEERMDAELERGRHAELVPELEGLVREHPLRERPRGQLMLALYRSGRQAEALEVFQAARRTLDEELGISPSPALQDLHRSILRQEAGIEVGPAAALEPDHFADVIRALRNGRLVVVVGTASEDDDDERNGSHRAPAGTDIAAHLARLFEYPPGGAADLTRVSQFVALTKGLGPLYDELRELLAAGFRPTAIQRAVAALPAALRERGAPPLLVVDTNYDDTLECAFADAGEAVDVVSYVASGRHRGKFVHCTPGGPATIVDVPNTYTDASPERSTVVLKIHGGLARADVELESFVVSEDDYIDYLARADISTFVPVAVAARLRRSHYLFLGYGVEEWRFRVFLHRIWGDEQLAYRSWAAQPGVQPLEREFWRRRGVDVLDTPLSDYVVALERALGQLAPVDALA